MIMKGKTDRLRSGSCADKFDEATFRTAYRKAYESIVPDRECIRRLADRDWEEQRKCIFRRVVMTVAAMAATAAVVCLIPVLLLPVMVKAAPGLYGIVARYAPSLADYCLPEERSSTKCGITMQVEAMQVEGSEAEILISFSDAEGGGDLIRGEAALFGSISMQSYGGESDVVGASFLGYDEAEDKVYFKIDVTTFGKFDKEKLVLTVGQLLTDCREETQWIDMEDMVMNPPLKEAMLYSRGGTMWELCEERELRWFEDGAPHPVAKVLKAKEADAGMKDLFAVNGIGYGDGILRVQVCRGNLEGIDRHAQLFLVDGEGNERHEDFSVGWHEEAGGERIAFDEAWFAVEEDELENLRLYGIFYRSEGCVKGGWTVTLDAD